MGAMFEQIRDGVTAREAAEMYGLEFNGRRARCPWNAAETRFNLSFERNGRCHCFAMTERARMLEGRLLLFRAGHGILGKEKPADPAGKRRMVS